MRHRPSTSICRHFANSRTLRQTITLPSHGRGRWFEPSIAHSSFSCICRRNVNTSRGLKIRPHTFYTNSTPTQSFEVPHSTDYSNSPLYSSPSIIRIRSTLTSSCWGKRRGREVRVQKLLAPQLPEGGRSRDCIARRELRDRVRGVGGTRHSLSSVAEDARRFEKPPGGRLRSVDQEDAVAASSGRADPVPDVPPAGDGEGQGSVFRLVGRNHRGTSAVRAADRRLRPQPRGRCRAPVRIRSEWRVAPTDEARRRHHLSPRRHRLRREIRVGAGSRVSSGQPLHYLPREPQYPGGNRGLPLPGPYRRHRPQHRREHSTRGELGFQTALPLDAKQLA